MYHILCNYIVKYDIDCFLKGIENIYVEKKQYEVKKITEKVIFVYCMKLLR